MSGIGNSKNPFQRLQKSFSPGRKLYAFLVCLFVAALLWTFNVLSETFTSYTTYQIQYLNIPGGKALPENRIKEISFEIYGSGFQMIHYLWNHDDKILQVDFADDNFKRLLQDNNQSISTYELFARQLQIKDYKLSIRSASPVEFGLFMDKKYSKTLPVVLNNKAPIAKDYYQTGHSLLQPPIITLYSSDSADLQLNEIKATASFPDELTKDYFGKVKLHIPISEEMSVSPSAVWVYVQVKEQASQVFEITLNSDPLYRQNMICLPSKVKVELAGSIEAIQQINPDELSAYVEFESRANATSLLPVKVKYPSKNIFSCKVVPSHVECYIRQND